VRLAAGKPVEAWPDLLVRWGTEHSFFTGDRETLLARPDGPSGTRRR